MDQKIINVLYVDDEQQNLISFTAAFRKYFNVFTALSSKEAEVILNKNKIHVLITDQRMPIKKGTELLSESVKKYPELTKIILSAFIHTVEVKEAVKLGYVFRTLEKPWDDEELIDTIKLGYESYVWKINRSKMMNNLNNEAKE